MNRYAVIGPLILFLALLLPLWVGLDFIALEENGLKNVASLLAMLVFVAALVERSMDVFLTAFRAPESEKLALQIENTKAEIADATGKARTSKTEELKQLEQSKLKRSAETRGYALWTGLVAGVVVSAAGVRCLQSLVDPEAFAQADAAQRSFFSMVDVLLTGGLIAGGSEGLHKFVEVVRAFLDTSTGKLKKQASESKTNA